SSSSDKGIEISDTSMTNSYESLLGSWSCTITGVAENTKQDYSYVALEFSVYDADGYNLGTALDNISNLAKGDKWKFEAHLYYVSTEPVHATLKSITALTI
ncbi:MAG: FxLYD domain-containing protein, partial [Clostridia bacterium]|nr:FxLYD domain-containing protein [Clostridia bacterium]